ncbi:MAG: ABC transporter ATP-binding protein [Acidimicrobiales bacterium]|nr:ABC transporter ATP-binding protein [Acidimicrobiales bacterium]
MTDAAPAATTPMVEKPALEVENLSVRYRVRRGSSGVVIDLAKLLTGRRTPDRVVNAVKNVTFEVPKGETLAIVGRNGAGKSTLLRALSGALPPAEGRITVRGRVSLLALGLGMNPKLSGRQNIRLGGLAVGLDEDRLEDLTPEIADFAQLGEYLDYPMDTYSAGMRSRLGFAVAANLDPEILLIDEALGGGDAGFTERARVKLAELMAEHRTIILVTHGLSSVRSMATSALWMHQGEVAQEGDPEDIIAAYMRYCRLEDLELPDEN